jgi:hypothetical protein
LLIIAVFAGAPRRLRLPYPILLTIICRILSSLATRFLLDGCGFDVRRWHRPSLRLEGRSSSLFHPISVA